MIGDKSLEQITSDDLRALVGVVSESKRLEFKRELPERNDAGRAEFLKDASAFANADGGDILYGVMQDSGGTAAGFALLDSGVLDAEILRLHQILDTGLRPRIAGVRMESIELEPRKSVLIVRIPASHIAPHQVVANGAYRFHSRNTSGTYALEVEELRDMILRRESLPGQVRAFRRNRIELIIDHPEDMPIFIESSERLVLHFIPLETFADLGSVDVSLFAVDSAAREAVRRVQPVRLVPAAVSGRPNIDGYFFGSGPTGRFPFYFQIFNDGSVECVDTTAFARTTTDAIFSAKSVEDNVFAAYRFVRGIFEQLRISGPVYVLMTVLGLRAHRMVLPPRSAALASLGTSELGDPIGRNPAFFNEVLIEDMGTEAQAALRPLIEQLWRAAGQEKALSYNDKGEYVG